MQVVAAVATKIVEYIVGQVGQWLCYSFQYSSNIEDLKNGVRDLQNARERLQHNVDAAIRNGKEIEADVNSWLKEVDEIIRKAKEVLDDEDKGKLRCASGKCLNLKRRHQLSRKAKKIVQGADVDKTLERGKFDGVSYHPPPEEIMTWTSKSYLRFESRQSTLVQLMEALKDTNINMIGVWGMGGIGKSTLVMEVSRQAKDENLFPEVAMADVGQSPDIRRIQGEIADMIGLKFDAETEAGRAKHLGERLTKDTNVLIVLDSIWGTLDVEEIGISCRGCKVLLISRNRDVLRQMGTQKDFGLQPLPEKEAWNLVVNMVGNPVKGPDFQDIATEIVKKCAGLPIALVTVFKALKDKSLEEWKDALRRLGRPALENLTKMQSTIYSCIELSYSHLESQEVKDFFLHCAQMPYRNLHMDLLKCYYGLGLFVGINTLEETRNNVYRLVRYLKDSGLLQDCSPMHHCLQQSEHFHMHDVVRDFAKLITSKDYNMIVVRDGDATREWPTVDIVKRCRALSIDGRDIDKLCDEMKFSELELFCVSGTFGSLQISDTLFQGMEKLRVLDLTRVQLLSLPPSIILLSNLQTLKLDGCVLEDIAIIGQLKNLAILSLTKSNIGELPQEIRLLTCLHLLDLNDCSELKVIPPNVLSSLVELEELYMRGTSIQWEVEGVNNERNKVSLIELKHLAQLIILEIDIKEANYLPNDLLFEKLERYNISIGGASHSSIKYVTPRTLKLNGISGFQLEVVLRSLLTKSETLLLDELIAVNTVLLRVGGEGFQHLKHLQIRHSFETKYIIDPRMSVIAFPILETLILQNMINLEEICHCQLSRKSFDKLRVVEIKGCNRLKCFISLSIANGLPQLEELKIKYCSNMTAIVVTGEGKRKETHTNLFPKLRHLALANLPKLKSLLSIQNASATNVGEIISKDKLDCYMQILHGEVMFPLLNELILHMIGVEDVQHNQHEAKSCKLANTPTPYSFQNLSNLRVEGSGNIKHLLSFSTAKFMVQLEILWIARCEVLEEVLLTKDLGVEEEEIPKMLFPRLKLLQLQDLPILKRFCIGKNINFPSLKELIISNCPRMKTFICKPISLGMITSKNLKETCAMDSSHSVTEPLFNEAVAFPSLEAMEIFNMVELKIIWQSQFTIDSFCKLKNIQIGSCENLMSIFQSNTLERFQNLEELFVKDCGSLEQVFELEGLNVEERHIEISIQLRDLSLWSLPKLRHIWNKDPHQFFSFQNLQEVWAVKCESLKSLFPTSIARHSTKLAILVISECGVEEIAVWDQATQAMRQLLFPQVKFLHLQDLPRLERFHREMHTLEWPKLENIWVKGCPFVCAPSSNEGTLFEGCKREICDKQVHFLFSKVRVLTNFTKKCGVAFHYASCCGVCV